jgi:hypothetical protein
MPKFVFAFNFFFVLTSDVARANKPITKNPIPIAPFELQNLL